MTHPSPSEQAPLLVTLPIDEIIRVYSGFWICMLCHRADRPGLGRAWTPKATTEAYEQAVAHLRERHQLREA